MNWTNGEYQPKQKRSDRLKQRILTAAITCFAESGFHKTTAKAIAAAAGVATGSFYRYFKDKKVLFLAACQAMEADLGGRIFALGRQMREDGHTEPEILTELVRISVRAHKKNRKFHREVLGMQISDPDVARYCGDRERRIRKTLFSFLSERADAYHVDDLKAASELLFYAVEDVSHRAIIFESDVGEDRLIRALQEMLRNYFFSAQPPA